MDLFEIDDFIAELRQIKSFFLAMEASRESLSVVGLKGINRWEGYEGATKALSTIETKLALAIRASRFIHPEISERLSNIHENSPLVSRAPEINIAVQVEEARSNQLLRLSDFARIVNVFAPLLGIARFKSQFSDDGTMPLRRMLVDIERLIPLSEELSASALRKGYSDDEVFKPSNVNIENVKVYIENTIVAIDASTTIDTKIKIKLNEYLTEVNAELVKELPSWKKVVGALIIVSTILSGVAAAPEAISNINSAVNYVLGTSIEDVVNSSNGPKFLPNSVEV